MLRGVSEYPLLFASTSSPVCYKVGAQTLRPQVMEVATAQGHDIKIEVADLSDTETQSTLNLIDDQDLLARSFGSSVRLFFSSLARSSSHVRPASISPRSALICITFINNGFL